MKSEEDIRREIERTLSVPDRLERADARPFFQTRLEARLEASQQERLAIRQRLGGLRPVWAVAILAFVLILNAAFILQNRTATGRGHTEQQLQEFYQFSTESAYDQLTTNP